MVCFFLCLLKQKLPQRCPKRGGGGGVKATFGQCPKGSSFFLRITSLIPGNIFNGQFIPPAQVAVRNPREIDEVFDYIRMLHSVMGEEGFRAGMRVYTGLYQYRTATTIQVKGRGGGGTVRKLAR